LIPKLGNLKNETKDLSIETHWETAAKTRMGKYLTNLETAFINKSISLQTDNLAIMDLGAEAGRFSLLASKQKATVVSIDLDPYALRRLRLKDKQVNIIQADARKLPIRDTVFDITFMIEVLDYIPELQEAFEECKRTLKPEASSILSFGNKTSLKAKLKSMQGKSYRHSYRQVIDCLKKTGFTICRKTGYSWLPFGRTSQSPLVPISAGIERFLGFRRIVRFSPWVIVHVTKPSKVFKSNSKVFGKP
jgi:ubiquinone/menaquinone biosynthesis C-methylase UbiE